MQDKIGLEASMFASEELVGSFVRLRVAWPVGVGQMLGRGETFTVEAVTYRTSGGGTRRKRWLSLSNHRAKMVPVEIDCCELLFRWPEKAERKS